MTIQQVADKMMLKYTDYANWGLGSVLGHNQFLHCIPNTLIGKKQLVEQAEAYLCNLDFIEYSPADHTITETSLGKIAGYKLTKKGMNYIRSLI